MEVIPGFEVPILEIAKAFLVFGFFIYLIFSLVVVRQVQLMTDTLNVAFEKQIRILAFGHLLFAAGVFVLAIIIL